MCSFRMEVVAIDFTFSEDRRAGNVVCDRHVGIFPEIFVYSINAALPDLAGLFQPPPRCFMGGRAPIADAGRPARLRRSHRLSERQ